MFYTKYLYNQNWNIGFSEDTVSSFLQNRALGKIQWMKHHYRDRFFADPFILKITDSEIIILAEELIFAENKGRIVKLVVDKITKVILERIDVLDFDTHLSYPAIIRDGDLIYIYPENSASGKLILYRYDDQTSKVTPLKTIIDEPLVDSTIFANAGKFWLVATKVPQSQENAYLYVSDTFDGEYVMIGTSPIIRNKDFARPAGNFIIYGDNIYRPAQNCIERYGAGISIQKIDSITNNSYSEKTLFIIYPKSFKYNLGLHTINFYNGGCIIDGYGFLYPLIGRVLSLVSKIKNKIVNE